MTYVSMPTPVVLIIKRFSQLFNSILLVDLKLGSR